MKRALYIYSLILLLLIAALQLTEAQENRAGIKLKYDLFEHISTETMLQTRNERVDNSRTRSYVGEYELNYTRNKYFKPGIAFRYKYKIDYSEDVDDQRNDRYRLSADLKIKIPEKIDNVSFTNRFRYQISVNSEGEDKNYFRNEFTMKYKPIKSLKAYVSPEVFYNLNKGELDKLRVEVGLDIKLTDRYEVGAFYMAETSMLQELSSYYTTGIELVIRL